MTSTRRAALVLLMAFLLWQPCVVSRLGTRAESWLMLIGIANAIFLILKAWPTRRLGLITITPIALIAAAISYACWRTLLHFQPDQGRGIDPFAGAIAIWMVFTFFLTVALVFSAVYTLIKDRPNNKIALWLLLESLATAATCWYSFYLTSGV